LAQGSVAHPKLTIMDAEGMKIAARVDPVALLTVECVQLELIILFLMRG
jgi:hypothetical protein